MDNVSVTITFDGVQQIVCLFVFNVPPTGKVIWGWGQSLKVLEATTPRLIWDFAGHTYHIVGHLMLIAAHIAI